MIFLSLLVSVLEPVLNIPSLNLSFMILYLLPIVPLFPRCPLCMCSSWMTGSTKIPQWNKIMLVVMEALSKNTWQLLPLPIGKILLSVMRSLQLQAEQ